MQRDSIFVRFTVAAALLALVPAMQCSNDGGSGGGGGGGGGKSCKPLDVEMKIVQAALDMGSQATAWRKSLHDLELQTAACRPGTIPQLRADAEAIVGFEPRCESWVRSYAFAKLASMVSLLDGTESQAQTQQLAAQLGAVCPVYPPEISLGRDNAGYVPFYVFSAARPLKAKLTLQGQETIELAEIDVGKAGQVYFDFERHVAETCVPGSLVVTPAEGSAFTISLSPTVVPEAGCRALAYSSYQFQLRGCEDPCCAFQGTEQCVRDLCDTECATRKKQNPDGHKAVKDACDATGEYYKWCHSFCGSVDSCRADWCEGDAPKKSACENNAKATYEWDLSTCPKETSCDAIVQEPLPNAAY